MPVYNIDYDLNKPGQDYSKVERAISGLGDYRRPLKSKFWVDTPLNAAQIQQHIASAFDPSDRYFISEVTSNNSGWLTPDDWNWLNQHLVARIRF